MVISCMVLGACTGCSGASQADYDNLVQENSQMSQDLEQAKMELGSLNSQLEESKQELESLNQEFEELKSDYQKLLDEKEMESEETKKLSEEDMEQEEAAGDQDSVSERKVSGLKFNGESVIEVTVKDMEEYDYIKDIYIKVDESGEEIDITVQIPSSTDEATAKMAGEDVARYLASCASWANDYYTAPGSSDIGGIYDKYDLLIYIDDGLHNFDIYGAKVTTAKKITWR